MIPGTRPLVGRVTLALEHTDRFRSPIHAAHPGWIGLILLAWLAQACNFPLATPALTPPALATATPAAEEMPLAAVTFQVRLPEDTPPRQPLFLSVLDEVTGLALNARRYEMQATDDLHYEITLPFPIGSTIKYRYTRQGDYVAEEHTSSRRPVRYRLYQVDGPGSVQDVVSAWSDTAFSGPVGRIVGTALDAQSGKPIPGLLVIAGGVQTQTFSDGSFILEGLPPGTHNLVALAVDGSYRPFQQGAVVTKQATTPAPIALQPAPLVSVTFSVTAPPGTMPAVPIRMAGSLYQLGNTFADLAGGMSSLAARMPALTPLPDGRYGLTLALPAGAHVDYKYTLGDGFWNAEHAASGEFRLRHLVIPEAPAVIEDRIESWGEGASGPVIFDLTIPDSTPENDHISIQFNPYGWTEPIPMWYLGEDHWVYVLYSPLDMLEKIGYRYCRNDQCGSADDLQTSGNESFGRILEISEGPLTVREAVEAWAWWEGSPPAVNGEADVRPRPPGFLAGVELQPAYHPSWNSRLPAALLEIRSLGASWSILDAAWTFTRLSPPLLEPVNGRNPSWLDLADAAQRARGFGLNAALFPTAQFPAKAADWWASAPRDFPWWKVWFERYRAFALHHADLAQSQGMQALILGGAWLSPALPGGTLADGSPSGVPADAAQRWSELLGEARARFDGQLLWALPFPLEGEDLPPFLDAVDQVYLLWRAPLAESPEASLEELQERAGKLLDGEVKAIREQSGKPLVLAVAYPAAQGGLTGCLPEPLAAVEGTCLDFELLARPNADLAAISLDLEEQARAYAALLAALDERDWIDGFVSRGFYPPAALQDKSDSVHGKPAGELLRFWFTRWLAGASSD